MVKFSIIIPVYCAEKTICRCVESIETNTFKDFEIILVEDGSLDNSWTVCCELASRYMNIKAIRNEKNCGVSYTRNRGLAESSGKYTMFVDSDDWVDAQYYETFAKVLEKEPESFLICGYVNHDEKQQGRVDEIVWNKSSFMKEIPLQSSLRIIYDKTMLQQLWNKAFITDVIRENNIKFDESISIGEDFRFVLSYLEVTKNETVTLINRPLYHYMRDQDGSLMFRVGYESVEEPLRNLAKMYEIMGMQFESIKEIIEEERKKQIRLYAYLIMHNAGMKLNEKKRLIYSLSSESGRYLFCKNLILFIKERIYQLLMKRRNI